MISRRFYFIMKRFLRTYLLHLIRTQTNNRRLPTKQFCLTFIQYDVDRFAVIMYRKINKHFSNISIKICTIAVSSFI